MFPNAVMMKQETWNDILRAMIAVRDAHGWREETKPAAQAKAPIVVLKPRKTVKPARRKAAKAVSRKPANRAVKKATAKPKSRVSRAKTGLKAKLHKPKTSRRAPAKARRALPKKAAKRRK
jgi:hypothetical protein